MAGTTLKQMHPWRRHMTPENYTAQRVDALKKRDEQAQRSRSIQSILDWIKAHRRGGRR